MIKEGLFRLLYGDELAHFFIGDTTPCGIDGAKKQRHVDGGPGQLNPWIEVDSAFPPAKICPECMEYVGLKTLGMNLKPMKINGGQENG